MLPQTELAIRDFLATTADPEDDRDETVRFAKECEANLKRQFPGTEYRESIEVLERPIGFSPEPAEVKLHFRMERIPDGREYGKVIWSGLKVGGVVRQSAYA